MSREYEDDRQLDEVPPSEPAGRASVTFDVPVPTIEQVTGQIARQLLADIGYRERGALAAMTQEAIGRLIDEKVAARAAAVIEELLERPIRPTDGFGQPVGEPTTLQAVLAQRVTSWCSDLIDRDGKTAKRDGYNTNSTATRMEWALGAIVHGELKKQIDVEVVKIVAKLKGDAATLIAKQIAEKVAGLVLK
jgi:hypothetical protein